MPFSTNNKIELVDASGDPLDLGSGTLSTETLRVTIAANDSLLTAMNTNLSDIETLATTIAGDTTDIESYFKAPSNSYSAGGTPQGLMSLAFRQDTLGGWFSGLGISDADWTYLQVNSKGGLYVTGSEVENAAVQSEPMLMGGRYDSSARTLDSGDAGAVALNASGHVLMDVVDGGQLDTVIDTLETTLTAIETDQAAIKTAVQLIDDVVYTDDSDGFNLGSSKGVMMMGFAGTQSVDTNDAAAIACTNSGHLKVSIGHVGTTTFASPSDVTLGGVTTYSEASTTGSMIGAVRNDVLDALANTDNEFAPMQVDAQGALYTTHGITGGADGVTTDDTNGTVLGGDVSCKKIDIQAQTDNTGVVAVGFTGVDATIATGTGILLNAGDAYSLEINNLNLIYIESSVNGEGVRYTYFT